MTAKSSCGCHVCLQGTTPRALVKANTNCPHLPRNPQTLMCFVGKAAAALSCCPGCRDALCRCTNAVPQWRAWNGVCTHTRPKPLERVAHVLSDLDQCPCAHAAPGGDGKKHIWLDGSHPKAATPTQWLARPSLSVRAK